MKSQIARMLRFRRMAVVILALACGIHAVATRRPATQDTRPDPEPAPTVTGSAEHPRASTGDSDGLQSTPWTVPERDAIGAIQSINRHEDAPAWAVGLGNEFWRRTPALNIDSEAPQPGSSPDSGSRFEVNMGDVLERVSMAWQPGHDGSVAQVASSSYAGRFDDAGLRFSPHRPNGSGGVTHDPETELTFRTACIRRSDGTPLYSSPGPGSGSGSIRSPADRRSHPVIAFGNTVQKLLNPHVDLVEHYEARSEGISVSWFLGARPPGDGGLVVETELLGLQLAARAADGHHYADASGQSRVCVGPAKLVDASGASWELNTDAAGTGLRITVPGEILDAAVYPLAIDPQIGAEFGVAGKLPGVSFLYETSPVAACNGTHYLVVWERSTNQYGADHNIIGARLTLNGGLVDSRGIQICAAPGHQSRPAVASRGSDFLVVWQDQRTAGDDGDIYGTFVKDGRVLQPDGIRIATGGLDQVSPSVAATERDYVVAWRDHSFASHLLIERFDIEAAHLTYSEGSPGIRYIHAARSGNPFATPKISAAADRFLIVWAAASQDTVGVYGAIVRPESPTPSSGAFAISLEDTWLPHLGVGSDGQRWLVVWSSGNDNGLCHGRWVYADMDGSEPFLVGGQSPTGYFSVASNGMDFLVTWRELMLSMTPETYVAAIPSSGPIRTWTVPGSAYRYYPVTTYGALGRYLVVSETWLGKSWGVTARLITATPPSAPLTVQFASPKLTVRESAETILIPVRLSVPCPGGVVVHYSITDETTASGFDYEARAGELLFNPGERVKTISLPMVRDTRDETDESFRVELYGALGGATIGANSRCQVVLLDDDKAGVVQFGAASFRSSPDQRTAEVTVVRSGGAASGVVVALDVSSTTGTLSSRLVRFEAGQNRVTLTVPITAANTPASPSTRFVLLAPAGGATLGSKTTAALILTSPSP